VKNPPPRGCIAFSVNQREWAQLSINQPISITSYPGNTAIDFLCSVEAEIDYFQKNKLVHYFVFKINKKKNTKDM